MTRKEIYKAGAATWIDTPPSASLKADAATIYDDKQEYL